MQNIVYTIINGAFPITVGLIGNGGFEYNSHEINGTYSFTDVPCGDYILVLKDAAGHFKFENITLPTVI